MAMNKEEHHKRVPDSRPWWNLFYTHHVWVGLNDLPIQQTEWPVCAFSIHSNKGMRSHAEIVRADVTTNIRTLKAFPPILLFFFFFKRAELYFCSVLFFGNIIGTRQPHFIPLAFLKRPSQRHRRRRRRRRLYHRCGILQRNPYL